MRTHRRLRLTQYAHGGGCACKIPADELEGLMARVADPVTPVGHARPGRHGSYGPGTDTGELLVGPEHGDDAAAVRLSDGLALLSTTDFFTPVVDDPYDWGRIAATNALSDIYAMGGTPILALNLLAWPRELLDLDLAVEVMRGGRDVAEKAQCHLAGGHSVDDPEPKYGLSVSGVASPERLFRLDAGRAGLPLSITKPLGIGVLNSRHKATGATFPQAVEAMTTLNADAAEAADGAEVRCVTDVTGFGLLGHLYKMARASGVSAILESSAVEYLDGARRAAQDGYVSGGTRRNLDWVRPHVDLSAVDETEALLLADAQTSGGLLVAGEIPGGVVIGELVEQGDHAITVRP